MPLYDYVCDHCGHRFEVRQGIREDALTECPECGNRIRRVIHPVGIVFKGSGFYSTDSRKQSTASSTPSSNGSGGEKKADAPKQGEGSAATAKAGDSAATAAKSDSSSKSSAPSGEKSS